MNKELRIMVKKIDKNVRRDKLILVQKHSMKSFVFHIKPFELAKLTLSLLEKAGYLSYMTVRIPQPPERVIPDHVRVDISCDETNASNVSSLIQKHGGLHLSEFNT